MSRMLTLIPAGLDAARVAARAGQRSVAIARLTRLLSLPDLPPCVAADAHRLAGELRIDREHYAAARRHLRAAARLDPTHAQSFYLLGLAFELDPSGDDRKAARCFRRASLLEPRNSLYRAAFGRAAVRCDRVGRGVRELLAVGDAGTGDLPVLRVVIDGLIEAGKPADARRVLVTARFLRPRDAAVRGLWDRVRFEAARSRQRTARGTQDARFATDGDFLTLPFLRPTTVRNERRTGRDTTRRDVVSFPKPHLTRAGMRQRTQD